MCLSEEEEVNKEQVEQREVSVITVKNGCYRYSLFVTSAMEHFGLSVRSDRGGIPRMFLILLQKHPERLKQHSHNR